MFGQARLKTMMVQSRVDFSLSTMLFVLILSLMTASCSAVDNKTPDTKVTAFIPKLNVMEHIFLGCLKSQGYELIKVTWYDFMY